MNERLNLTIDGALLEAMKAYAASKEISVSELVESYFRSVTKPVERRSILDIVDGLEAPAHLELCCRALTTFPKAFVMPAGMPSYASAGETFRR